MADAAAVFDGMRAKLSFLYGDEAAPGVLEQLQGLLSPLIVGTVESDAVPSLNLTEQDVVLITYGDQARRTGEVPLQTLHQVLRQTIAGLVNSVHILPFYPYSSDDGFSVIDYYQVDPALGTWNDLRALHRDFRLMFDAVFNHISAESAWFKAFLQGQAPYTGYFVSVDPTTDLSLVVRPRALPLLTRFDTATGEQHVWTTFSADQIDLNIMNPAVLVELVKALLFYVQQGADLIRLDAIAFLWKQPGTSSIHLPQTHTVVQLLRDVLDYATPHIILITETNVPHPENISYFGDGGNEAQLVYQFPLPPLTLHTLHTGDATALTRWAQSLEPTSPRTTFFNFLASHDGIGMRPAFGLLTQTEIDALVQLATDHGGFVSYRTLSDGGQSPYELNITYFDAITNPQVTDRDPATAIARFIASQSVMLVLAGVPGIYFHSLFGSRNDQAGVNATGRYRSINREKLDADRLLAELREPASLRARVFSAYAELLRVRAAEPAFAPNSQQRVLDLGAQVFAVERISADGAHHVVALTNVSGAPVSLMLPTTQTYDDLLAPAEPVERGQQLTLQPYQVAWLKLVL